MMAATMPASGDIPAGVMPTDAMPTSGRPRVEWALHLASRGLPIHPLHHVTAAGICSCGVVDSKHKAGKHPLLKDWQTKATTNPETIRAWWRNDPHANVGISTAGLIVLDFDGEDGQATRGALDAAFGALPVTFEQRSGAGTHVLLRKPDGVTLRNTQGRLGAGLGGRIAGKTKVDVRTDGGNLVGAGSVHVSGRLYAVAVDAPIADAPTWLVEELLRLGRPAASPASSALPVERRKTVDAATAVDRARAYARLMEPAVEGSGGDPKTFGQVQKVVRGFDLSEETAFAILWDEWNPRCSPPWDEKRLRRKVHQAVERGTLEWGKLLNAERERRDVRPAPLDVPSPDPEWVDLMSSGDEPPSDGGPGVPTIRLGADAHRVVDEAIAALAADGSTYSRGGALVRIVRTTTSEQGRIRRSEGTAVIRPHTSPSMFETLTRVARWKRLDGRSKKWSATTPPEKVVLALMHRGAWHGVPELVGLSETPILRGDGSIAQTPGFDAASGYFLAFRGDAFAPSPSDRLEPMRWPRAMPCAEIVCDFPSQPMPIAPRGSLCSSPCSRGPPSSAPSRSSPCYPTCGARERAAVDAAAILKTGRAAPRATQPADEAEAGKVFTSILLEGDELVLFDNISSAIGGAKLDALLTGETWKDRLLGGNSTVNLPIRTVFAAGGNNLEIIGDTARRVLPSTLESDLERPEDRRDFQHPNLLEWLRAERPRLVVAVLTALRAWFVAGRPRAADVRPWGSYESFAALVPHALRWLDLPDPQATRLEIEARDPVKGALATVLGHWRALEIACGKVHGITIREATDRLYPSPPATPDEAFNDLRDALELLAPGKGGARVDGRALGKVFQRSVKRTIDGKRLERAEGDARTKSNRWTVR